MVLSVAIQKIAYLALGGNVDDVSLTFEKALAAIADKVGRVTKRSSYYVTKPLMPILKGRAYSSHNFLNAVIVCETNLSPIELLSSLHEIERNFGRNRDLEHRWGPRTLDIDILAVDDLIITTENLTIPHLELHKRDFVLVPLCEVAPEFVHPVVKKTAEELFQEWEDSEKYPRTIVRHF